VQAPADELAQRLESFAAELDQARRDAHAAGLAVAVVLDDKLVFARGLGLVDVEQGRAATPESIFAIGSTTKAFTATLLTELAAEKGFALEDPVSKHLPWFEPPVQAKRKANLVDLLSHRTGFVRMDVLWYGGKATREEILRTALGAEPIAKLGETFLYNNVMYLAAGEVCEEVGGASWEQQITQRFLQPLAMTSTTLSVAEAQKDARLALGYNWDGEKQRFVHAPMRDLAGIAPAGSINSTVLDLAHWVRCQLALGEFEGKRVVRRESIERTWKKENKMDGTNDYGLGWMLPRWRGERAVWHGGNIDGFTAAIWLLPERKAGLALLVNATGSPLATNSGPMAFEALFPAPEGQNPVAAEAAASEDLERFTGSYVANYFTFHDARFVVTAKDGVLAVDVPGQTNFALKAPNEKGLRAFALAPNEIQASFEERDGQVVVLRLHQGGLMFECPREGYVAPMEVEAEQYEPFLGRFDDPLTKKTFEVVIAQGRLACDYPGQMVYGLLPPDDEEQWVFRATPAMALEFVLDADGRAEAVVFHEKGTERTCERAEDDATLPTVDELMTLRKVDEFERRLAELAPCRLETKIHLVNCGIRGTVAVTFDAGTRFTDHTDLAPFVESHTVSQGDTTRTTTTLSPEGHDLTGKNHLQALLSHPATLFGDWRKRFDQVKVLRSASAGDKLVTVKLVKGDAPPGGGG
ncbi:MAG: serine hydrolase domain-containing protein, partial [Planctomycetota bacterium]